MQVTLDISDKFAAAINGLSEAIRFASGATTAAAQEVGKSAAAVTDAGKTAESKAESGPIFWADNSTGYFGKVATEAEYAAKKAEADGVYKITETIYNEKQAALKGKNAADAKAKKAADAKAKKEADTKKGAESTTEKKGAEHPPVEALVEVFARYLPKDLDKETRAERAKFVKPLLERFGAARASELLPEHRALAMNLVERKMAGEDIDPTSADFAEVCAEVEEDMI
ncbi:hypothetical protein [Stutzerimonas nitrititolerans]|uniref:hypothetical protein n=1 Tax=Stutzerimonas nitrititolerans TaxID=2482751 RepID=UPI00289E5F73|nr:hypothetical protein [Stutzerimonas nitrititolerans]